VYVETTIPSFHDEVRTTPDIVARREWTRQWWNGAPERYELVTSAAVLDELAGGLPERGARRLALVRDLPLRLWKCSEAPMKKSRNDPVIDEIREIRRRISARFDHDPARMVVHYMELQKRYRDRLIEAAKNDGRGDQSVA
jgi:hypothetical protein